MKVFTITNTAAVPCYDSNQDILDVAIAENQAYFAAHTDGLLILRLVTDEVVNSVPVTGGSLSSTDGTTILTFPSGAFTQTVDVTFRGLLYDENAGSLDGIGHTFDITAVVLVNGTISLALGYLYWSQGWEAAVLAHFIADVVVRVIGHTFIKT